MQQLSKLTTFLAMILCATLARADSVTYTFSNFLFNVSFNEPSIITHDVVIPASDLLSNNTPDLLSVEINPTSPICGTPVFIPPGSSCIFFNQPTQGTGYIFSLPLTSAGTYASGNANLTIAEPGMTPPVPEPSTLFLLGAGGLSVGLNGLLRFRKSRHRRFDPCG
jgi:hypothetical protein